MDVEDLRYPREWAKHRGIEIVDAGGWINDRRSWFEKITLDEFDRLAAESITKPRSK